MLPPDLARLSCAVTAILLLGACVSDQGQEATPSSDGLLVAAAPDDTVTAVFAERLRALLRALADTTRDPTPLLGVNFTFYDVARPAVTYPRDPSGRLVRGLDYFKAMSRRVSAEHGDIARIEVFP